MIYYIYVCSQYVIYVSFSWHIFVYTNHLHMCICVSIYIFFMTTYPSRIISLQRKRRLGEGGIHHESPLPKWQGVDTQTHRRGQCLGTQRDWSRWSSNPGQKWSCFQSWKKYPKVFGVTTQFLWFNHFKLVCIKKFPDSKFVKRHGIFCLQLNGTSSPNNQPDHF